jgi:hypothetical protein
VRIVLITPHTQAKGRDGCGQVHYPVASGITHAGGAQVL